MTTNHAEQRALDLLPRVLSPRERAHFEKTDRIVITGSEGGRYEILRHGYVGNVVPLQDVLLGLYGTWVRAGTGLCAHPQMVRRTYGIGYELPRTDAHIAQILAIKSDEKRFLRIANVWGFWREWR